MGLMSSGTIVTQLLDHITVQRTLVASATVLVYDVLCTLDQEVEYVWSRPRTISSLLFFLNRYLPFIDTFLSLALSFSNSISPENCQRLFSIVTCFIVVGTLISEAILMLRICAIWERRRCIVVILAGLALGLYIPGIAVAVLEIKSLRFAYNDTQFSGCHVVHASTIIFVAYVLLVIAETVMVVLTCIQAYRYMREHARSDWVASMYRTGVLFYFYLLAVSLANILVPLLAPPSFANWLATPQRILHSILCTRVLLLIFRQRSENLSNYLPTDDPRFTTLQFGNTFLRDADIELLNSTTSETRSSDASPSGRAHQYELG